MGSSRKCASLDGLLLGVFLFWCALYLFVPTLPLYALTKTGNLGLVGLALAQYGLWQAILRFPLGLAASLPPCPYRATHSG